MIFVLCQHNTKAFSQSKGGILFPTKPRQIVPPSPDPEKREKQLRKKRQHNIEQKKSIEPPKPPSAKLQQEALAKNSVEERPMRFMLQASLVYPTIMVNGERKDYTTEITSHLHLFFRTNIESQPGSTQFWWGARVAPFSGTGFYKGIPGRYNFTYFGPMLGIGSLSPINKEKNKSEKELIFGTRSAWSLMAGVAGQIRTGKTEREYEEIDNDLDSTKGGKLDGNGLWIEATYMSIRYGAISTNYILGAQLGEGKRFIYLSVGFGGWY